VAEAAETGMAMHYLNLLSDYNVPKDWKEGEERWHCRLPINDEKGDMVYFEPIRKVVNSCTAFVGMSDDNDLVAAVDELCGELIDVAFNSSWLGKEEVADHGNVVRHFGRGGRLRPAEQQSCDALLWRSKCEGTHDL
jgi:hypothetical protein